MLKVRLKTYRMKMHIIYYSHVFLGRRGVTKHYKYAKVLLWVIENWNRNGWGIHIRVFLWRHAERKFPDGCQEARCRAAEINTKCVFLTRRVRLISPGADTSVSLALYLCSDKINGGEFFGKWTRVEKDGNYV